MRTKQILAFFILLIISLSNLEAKIVETDRMDDILQVIDDDTVVFFDIDETLVYIPTMMGSTSWWNHCLRLFRKRNWDLGKVSTVLMPNLHYAAVLVKSELVEPSAPTIIDELKKRGIKVFGLTARSRQISYDYSFDQTTINELGEFGIVFTQAEDIGNMYEYFCGILFTGGKLKGPVLEKFLRKLKLKKKKIVFIDDNSVQINSVDVQMASAKIPTVCFRYNKMDRREFNTLIANIQLKGALENHTIFTNEQALDIANHLKIDDPDFYLQYLFDTESRLAPAPTYF